MERAIRGSSQPALSSMDNAVALFAQTQMKLREAEYTRFRDLSLLVASWNVNGKGPSESVVPWLCPANQSFDIVVCGLQEFDVSASALVLSETAKVEPWVAVIGAALNRLPEAQYVLLAKQQLGGVLELVWVRRELVPHVRDVQIHYTSTGIGNVLANKGGTAVRLDVFDSTMCFVCAHLNAHDENVERRNQDYVSIVSSVRFSDNRSIWDHDFLFWFGDLNYRIELPRGRIFALIEAGNWDELVAYDQLTAQKKLGAAFVEFTEGRITWAPTYRYDAGTNTYDTSEKQRKPSYTDRVMHKASSPKDVKLQEYSRVAEMMQSDHKPVYARYSVRVREILQPEFAQVYASVLRDADKIENDIQPQAGLSSNDLDFGEVRYGVPIEREFQVINSGQVMFHWKFLPKPGEGAALCKRWAWVEPTSGSLMPNESHTVKVGILVDNGDIAYELSTGQQKLEDILVLHLDVGKDYFVTFKGRFLQSCFGCMLDHLVRIPQPIRTASNVLKPEDSLRVPKEIWALVDYIYRNCMDEPDLFLQRGIHEEICAVRECLDVGQPLSVARQWSPHSVAETLLQLLQALPQPVVPVLYYAQVVDPNTPHSLCRQIIEALPDANFNVFYYLVSFGKEFTTPGKYMNNVKPEEFAAVLGNVLLRPPNDARYKKTNVMEQHEKYRTRFVQRFFETV